MNTDDTLELVFHEDVPVVLVPQAPTSPRASDVELDRVLEWMLRADPSGKRTGRVIRDTFDQLYDGENTGHFRPSELRKTEKTHIGTVVEINMQREFGFQGGQKMDYTIEGADVDCKFSLRPLSWMLPRESVGHLCLLLHASDEKSSWSSGLIRVTDELLNVGRNLDSKRTLNTSGRGQVRWIHRDQVLPENVLLHMSEADREAIFGAGSASKQVAELFRRREGLITGRSVVRTVGRQLDYMNRIRANGGARDHLHPQGYVVLSGDTATARSVAAALDLPVPETGEFVCVRLHHAESDFDGPIAVDGSGCRWRRATAHDPMMPFSAKWVPQ